MASMRCTVLNIKGFVKNHFAVGLMPHAMFARTTKQELVHTLFGVHDKHLIMVPCQAMCSHACDLGSWVWAAQEICNEDAAMRLQHTAAHHRSHVLICTKRPALELWSLENAVCVSLHFLLSQPHTVSASVQTADAD